MFGMFKNIFGSKNETELNEMGYSIDFVYSYETGDTIKDAVIVFPPDYDEVIVNSVNYRLDTYYVEDIGYSSDRKYRKIKIPEMLNKGASCQGQDNEPKGVCPMQPGRGLTEMLNKGASCQGQENEPKGVCPMRLGRGLTEATEELLAKTLT